MPQLLLMQETVQAHEPRAAGHRVANKDAPDRPLRRLRVVAHKPTVVATGLLLSILAAASVSAADDDKQVIAAYRDAAAKSGDAQRGRVVFQSKKAGCTKCHTVGERKKLAGPDLSVIGDKYLHDQLVQSVLEPSASIHPDYATITVVTKDGKTHNGVLKRRTKAEIELFDAEGKTKTLLAADVEEEKRGDVSLMPKSVHQTMNAEQFADLIAWLKTLRQNVSDIPGMPSKIRMLAKPIHLEPLHSEEMRFDHPVWIIAKPGTENTFMVVEQQTCKVWQLEKRPDGDRRTLFVDMSEESISGRFEGVMCLAFHPDFLKNGKYYLNHHIREDGIFSPVIVERQATNDLSRDSGQPTRRLLRIKQETDLHWGGMLAFGPDAYLYIGAGDGGPQEDPDGHGQNLRTWQGKILRIDVNGRTGDLPYAIPPSNPFVDRDDALPEIWNYGLRMPWRFSWDSETDEMWIGDIGQNLFEQVRMAKSGDNHGWNVYEGFFEFSDRYRRDNESYRPPVYSYRRRDGVSVTGGYVYRGRRSPSFTGAYIFGDFESKRIWALKHKNGKLLTVRQIGTCPEKPCSFGMASDGEIFVVGYEGTIFRLRLDDAVFE